MAIRKFVDNVPAIKRRLTGLPKNHEVKMTMNVGSLYPIDVQEVLPGSVWEQSHAFVARTTSALKRPIMDNLFLDVYSFFVPLRILQKNAENVFANVGSNRWYQPNVSTFANWNKGTFKSGTVSSKTVADYLGLPVGRKDLEHCSVLPFRAFAHIWNEFFRKETVMNETAVFDTDVVSGALETLNNNAWSVTNYCGKLPPVSKYVDLFTSATVEPQLGPAIPFATTLLPVIAGTARGEDSSARPHIIDSDGYDIQNASLVTSNQGNLSAYDDGPGDDYSAYIDNLYADPTTITVDELRNQSALQKMAWLDAAFGCRYREYLLGHYGVQNGDARMQVPELLCGGHYPISIQQVVQSSGVTQDSSGDSEDLGTVAGMSVTSAARQGRFKKSITEHGYIFTVGCIRQKHTYSQGVPALFGRIKREHFFDPAFAFLGNQPVYMSEIYAEDNGDLRGDVFGYNEAWSNYRTIPDQVKGEFRDMTQGGLGHDWTLADYYANRPTIAGLVPENPDRLDDVLVVDSSVYDQFALDFHFNVMDYSVLPAYSEPPALH